MVVDSDELLVQRIQEGSQAAFAQLLAVYWPRILTHVRKFRIHGYTQDDLAQEMVITLWQTARLYRPTKATRFSTFFWACARNRTRKLYLVEQQDNRLANVSAASAEVLEEANHPPVAPDDFGEIDVMVSIRTATDLSSNEKAVCLLRTAGYTGVEIAKMLRLDKRKVNRIVTRLRQKGPI